MAEAMKRLEKDTINHIQKEWKEIGSRRIIKGKRN
jgi:hypothetical protein